MPSVVKRYSDFDLNFIASPISGDIQTLRDVDSVKRSVRNLILTGKYERPMRPNIGSGITKLLFDNITPVTEQKIKIAIQDTIRNHEPRANLIEVDVNADPDNNRYNATITFSVDSISEIVTLTLFLERAR